jgi:hypothetical protein
VSARAALFAIALFAGACAAANKLPSTNASSTSGSGGGTMALASSNTASSTSGGGGGIGSGGSFTTGGGSGGSNGDCPDEVRNIYMIGDDGVLYTFDPSKLMVSALGAINCPPPANPGPVPAKPLSMAVDRQGIAWVLFDDGNIYHVDVKTVVCTASGYVPNQMGFLTFGMGFVSDSPGSQSETLYVADYLGYGLCTIDTKTLKLSIVGSYGAMPGAGELTGTGDAKLYGFFATGVDIDELDKSTSKILSSTMPPNVSIGTSWAFAFWGGDFWLFTNPNGTSQITQYKPANGTATVVKSNLPSNIVGAGVSTCAPTVPAK